MDTRPIIEKLGIERAIRIDSTYNLLGSQKEVIDQIKEKGFNIDQIYFSQDEKNSYPAVFIKKVILFDTPTLKLIADIHKKAWNYKKVSFLYVYNDTEIRIYNCVETPVFITDNINYEEELKKKELASCKQSDKKRLDELTHIFSSVAIDSGSIWSTEEAAAIRNKIKLQQRVDQYLVESLTWAAEKLKEELEIKLIHKLILRSLFLLYLEDRGATDKKFYTQFKNNAKSYFDIVEDVEATYLLFEKLEEHFNGNVFSVEEDEIEKVKKKHLQIISRCFTSGYKDAPLFPGWRLFDFSIIQIELLSRIYENFLAKVDPKRKNDSGVHYTPPSLVELILNEKLPVDHCEKYNLKVLDPACGSGIFLVESFKRLVKRYENHHKRRLTDFETLKKLLTDNIYGIECDSNAIRVAAFSLYLALVDCLEPKTLWQVKRLPYLINDPDDKTLKEQGENLYKRDTIEENKEIESIDFELVVGNPPFGIETEKRKLPESIRTYCDKHGFAKEMVLPFLHKAAQFAPKGEIAMIFNTKILTNTSSTYQNFRKWLMQECYVEKVYNFSILRKAPKDFGGQLFGDAIGPISVVFYKKEQPENPNSRIVYYAPKTYVKSNVLEGIVIDSTDVKYLPREECQKPDTKIWKIAMWGGMNDWELIMRLSNSKLNLMGRFAENVNIKSGVGFQLLTQKKDKPKYSQLLTNLAYLDADFITKYYTPDDILRNVTKSIKSPKATDFYKKFYNVKDIAELEHLTAFRRLGDMEAFTNPHIVVKKGLEQNSVCASFIEKQCSFRDGVYGFYANNENIEELYLLLSYFNSKLSTYYLFMTISSYGVEREQIMKNEYLSIPVNLSNKQSLKIKEATKELLLRCKSKQFSHNSFENQEIETYINNNIDEVIYESLSLSVNDINLLHDSINYSIDLFHNQEKSKALYPVLQNQITEYGESICKELNDFLDGQDLFVNVTVYNNTNRFTPLMMIKLTHEETKKDSITTSNEKIDDQLKKLDQYLWKEESNGIYFRKKLNYYDGDDIYIIRPNQRRFWSRSMAIEDASELILEILNGD